MLALKWKVLFCTVITLIFSSPVFGEGLLPGGKTIGQRLDNLGKSMDDLSKSVLGPIFGTEEDQKTQSEKATQTEKAKPRQASSTMIRQGPDTTAAAPSEWDTQPKAAVQNRDGETSEMPDFGKPLPRPLYERFNQYRKSVFDSPPERAEKKDSSEPAASKESSGTGRLLEESLSSTLSKPSPDLPSADSSASEVRPRAAVGQPTPAKRPRPGTDSAPLSILKEQPLETFSAEEKGRGIAAEAVAENQKNSNLFVPQTSLAPPAAEENVLIARRGPLLSVETLGPRKITVGKESAYEVTMINSGDVAAEELVLFVNLPEWAEVIGAETSSGVAQVASPGQPAAPLQWRLSQLSPKAREKLVLRIIPRQSRPFDLAVRWEYKPVASQAMIEVQEPRLELQLDGPREVFYGKKEIFRLKLANTGNGDAENVMIKLFPVGAGENVPAVYTVGALAAGAEKAIEVELTARQAGILKIQVEARGDTGIHAELSEKVLVRRAGLDVNVEGPKLQFVGATATYTLRLRNPGNAPARNITFHVTLPSGMRYTGGVDDAQTNALGNKVQWLLGTLNPEVEQTFLLKCALGAAGANRLEISVTAEDDLAATTEAVTQVNAVANLELDVKDPGGPVLVGDEATYTIRVRNRGTKEAPNVEVFGYFSRGIEPTRGEGFANRVSPGQVVFSPIPVLAPGAEAVLKIHSKAEAPGNHIFRAEIHCQALGSRLINEANTLYYQEKTAEEQEADNRAAPGTPPPMKR